MRLNEALRGKVRALRLEENKALANAKLMREAGDARSAATDEGTARMKKAEADELDWRADQLEKCERKRRADMDSGAASSWSARDPR